MKKLLLVIVYLFFITSIAFGQVANGKLQLHFIDVGQGDAAVLISPGGETVMFDNGVPGHCDRPLGYLDKLGITKIDYQIASHYHADHVGCTKDVLENYPLQKTSYDRGPFTGNVYKGYEKAVGTHRKTAVVGDKITLDAATNTPVTIEIVALNGAGIETTNENDLSVVAVIHFGKFSVEMGGDLSGFDKKEYKDIESTVAEKMQPVDVYKIHHHCSKYSTNEKWLSVTKPKIGIVSASNTIGRNYGHPTAECLERLHQAGVKTYWTERSGGADPDPKWDVVGGDIVVETEPNGNTFTVTYNGSKTDTYPVGDTKTIEPEKAETYAWSRNSKIYHYGNCSYVSSISSANLRTGNAPPAGKKLHEGCPAGDID